MLSEEEEDAPAALLVLLLSTSIRAAWLAEMLVPAVAEGGVLRYS